MSVFSAPSLSASDVSFTRQLKPLPKRRRTSLRRFEVEGHISTADQSLISAQYHSISNGRIDKLEQEFNVTPSHSRTSNKYTLLSARSRTVDDADGEGDYADHLQQPNNTKKRKVPAAATTFARESNYTWENDDLADEDSSQDSQANVPEKAFDDAGARHSPQGLEYQPVIARRQSTSLLIEATMRIKELFKARRQMMATAIHDGIEPLALELAFSAAFTRPQAQPPIRACSYGPKFRHRPNSRTATLPNRKPWFSRKFTFSFPSPISKRYTIAKKVAAKLQLRFQTELARQATVASDMTLKTTSKLLNISSSEQNKVNSGPSYIPSIVPSADKLPQKPNKSKKKKRSALANASNPHHLRNYVPSRVSHPGGIQASSSHGQVNSLGPLALKFLSSTLAPRSKGRIPTGENMGSSLTRPETEWICPFCEYSLFYGDEAAMQRAVRNRRRILVPRRNARERAATAASGATVSRSRDTSDDEDDNGSKDDDDSFGEGSDSTPGVPLTREAGVIGTRQNNKGSHPGG